jgi:hypothetical protein
MERYRGSALIETLIASFILVSGLVSVASMFSVTRGVSLRNQQRATATLLLYEKMEQLRGTNSPFGGSLDPQHPESGFMDYVRIASDGRPLTSSDDPGRAYLRVWQAQDFENPTLTIAVFGRIGSGLPTELVRATGPH